MSGAAAASVEGITRADLASWHAAWFKPGSATLVVAGDTTMEQLLPALEASFGKWQPGTAPAKALATAGKAASRKTWPSSR